MQPGNAQYEYFCHGDKSLFAVIGNIFLEHSMCGSRQYGSMEMVCAGIYIGDCTKVQPIDITSYLINVKLHHYDFTLADYLSHFDMYSVIERVNDIAINASTWQETEAINAIDITLKIDESFDKDILVLLSTDVHDRLVWKNLDTTDVREFFFPPRYVINTLQEFIAYMGGR